MKIIALAAVAAALSVTLMAGTTAPAQAAGCYYKAVNLDGRVLNLQAYGHATKKSRACDRARRQCNRKLDRAYRKGQMPRGVVCKRSG